MTRLMHEYALGLHHADWVLPLDADEFIHLPGCPGQRAAVDEGSLIPKGTRLDAPLRLF